MFHLALHFIVPLLVAFAIDTRRLWKIWGIMVATMVVDIDHLLADPIYDPMRCSIGFHPLHQLPMIGFYALLCLFPKTRFIGIGLCIHMALDSIDCQFTNGVWTHAML